MTPRRWKRVGKRGGPGNVLDCRWEIHPRADGTWVVYDLQRDVQCRGIYTTMAYAREAAWRRAARAGSERWT